jgi:hypothetical protein
MALLAAIFIGHVRNILEIIHQKLKSYEISNNMHASFGMCSFSFTKEMTKIEHLNIKNQHGPMPHNFLSNDLVSEG